MNGFLKIPFVPDKKVRHVIISGNTPPLIIENLKKMNIYPILSIKCSSLYDAVSYHPDMVLHPIGGNIIVCAPEVFDYYSSKLTLLNYKFIKGKSCLSSNYPNDIAYNVARINKFAFHNVKYTDNVIREYFEKNNIKLINVKQGYSKCSTCIINTNAIITSDKGIAVAADNYNIDVLFIKPGYIDLPGLNYGFIGGATGLISKNKIIITGNIKHHANYKQILEFCNKYSVDIINLSDKGILDIGSVIPI